MTTDDERRFPLPRPTNDTEMFSYGLAYDVAKVLAEHGYPDITSAYQGAGRDFVDLQRSLFGFLYADRDQARQDDDADGNDAEPARPDQARTVDMFDDEDSRETFAENELDHDRNPTEQGYVEYRAGQAQEAL